MPRKAFTYSSPSSVPGWGWHIQKAITPSATDDIDVEHPSLGTPRALEITKACTISYIPAGEDADNAQTRTFSGPTYIPGIVRRLTAASPSDAVVGCW